jgi:hypothetical protein
MPSGSGRDRFVPSTLLRRLYSRRCWSVRRLSRRPRYVLSAAIVLCFCVLGWLAKLIAAKRHGFITQAVFPPSQRLIINAEVARLLKQNRYDQVAKTLTFSEAEAASYQRGSAYVADGGPNRQDRKSVVPA